MNLVMHFITIFIPLFCTSLELVAFTSCRAHKSTTVKSSNANIQSGVQCTEPATIPIANLKVALIGDTGAGADFEKVLRLIQKENAHFIIHSGDLGYGDPATVWEAQINKILGDRFPYFVTPGNHEFADGNSHWHTYQALLFDRLRKVTEDTPDTKCTNHNNNSNYFGVQTACTYKGLSFILSGAGTTIDGSSENSGLVNTSTHPHAMFLQNELTKNQALWKLCVWHKNQTTMQVGTKDDEVGWWPYELCREYGAIIVTGHEHSYARSHLLSNIRNQTVVHQNPEMEVRGGDGVLGSDALGLPIPSGIEGQTIVIQTGLGGHSIRPLNARLSLSHWGSAWTSTTESPQPPAEYGALFCVFNVNNEPSRAECYFKGITGKTPLHRENSRVLNDAKRIEHFSLVTSPQRALGQTVCGKP